MSSEIIAFNKKQTKSEQKICNILFKTINLFLPESSSKIWHAHPVWFLDDNPVVGYSKLKAGIRLMFWSGASFDEPKLKKGTGKFKDASILYTELIQIDVKDLQRWLMKSKKIQWDYKNIYKQKGKLYRLK